MSLRLRLMLASSAAVAVAVCAACAAIYVSTTTGERANLDLGLERRALAALRVLATPGGARSAGRERDGRVVAADGSVVSGELDVPVSATARSVAGGERADAYETLSAGETPTRVYTLGLGDGRALQTARPLAELEAAFRRLRSLLLTVALGGVVLAALLGWLVAGRALAPVRRLTGHVVDVARTQDLARRVDGGGDRELGTLAHAFNDLLGALERSLRTQRQLVADASHELRTPLASLRTNLEVLFQRRDQPPADIEADLVAELEQMARLVDDLLALARGDELEEELEPLRLDLLVEAAVEVTASRPPHPTFRTRLEPVEVNGAPALLERAVANLLHNAAKWSPQGEEIDVHLNPDLLAVRDRGPGIDADDLTRVFDRFYRAHGAHGVPGSGLGLAIVRQAVERHGWAVAAERAEGGGTRIVIRWPSGAASLTRRSSSIAEVGREPTREGGDFHAEKASVAGRGPGRHGRAAGAGRACE